MKFAVREAMACLALVAWSAPVFAQTPADTGTSSVGSSLSEPPPANSVSPPLAAPALDAPPDAPPAVDALPAAEALPAPDAAPSVNDPEEIVVTVQRRRQSIQRVPGSVQAISADDLQTKGIGSDFRNLQLVVPGLQITTQEGQIEVFIRGIGSTNNDFSSDPAVATHYNGVYIARPRGIGPMFYDAERVEVNKGPQGTLRGRNATGGTINIISRRPDLSNFGGYVQSGFGNLNSFQLEGAVNAPIVEDLALRAAVFHQRHDPFYSNAINNGVEGAGQQTDVAFRVSALWEPTSRLSAYVVFDWAEQNGTGDPGQFWGGALSAGFDSGDLDDPRDQFFLQEGDLRNQLWGLTGVIKYDFGPVIAEYNGGFRTYDFFNKNAQRPFQQGVNYPGVDISSFDLDNFGTFYQLEESTAIVQEVRLYSPDDHRFRWSGGVFFYNEDFGRVSWDITDRTLSQSNLGGQNVVLPDSNIQSLAFYGDATFDITDRFRVRAGARFTTEEKEERSFQAQYTFDFGDGVTADDVRSGTPGFELQPPSRLTLTNPTNADPAEQFLDAIRRFGARDTLGDLIAENPGSVSLTTTDPAGLENKKYDASYVNWRVGLEYDLARRNMVYASASTGTRSGGINPTITLPDNSRLPVTFDPENLLVVEVGSKNRFRLGPLPVRLNGAFFWYKYTDQVLQGLVAGRDSGGGLDEQQNFLTNANVGE
ncbi:MAG: TonB-dependent receptor, partial [Myxococcota bacterium]